MLQQLQKRKESGFTIIEVLIVLAIAGLIMVVVFLAVPALQRNAHNQQYKTEANNLLSAYAEQSNNNGGAILASTDASAVATSANTKTISNFTITATAAAQSPAPGTAVITTSAKCPAGVAGSTSAITPAGGTSRQIAIIYGIEAASGSQYQCTTQ
jgi:type IV pilus assembly protein PilA